MKEQKAHDNEKDIAKRKGWAELWCRSHPVPVFNCTFVFNNKNDYMLSANTCPFLRTVVWISDSKLRQFINFEYYAFILSFPSLY